MEQSSHWLGEATRRTESYEQNQRKPDFSQSCQFGQIIGWQELLPQSREEAQLLQRGTAGQRVREFPDWNEFVKIFDQAVSRRLERRHGRRLAQPCGLS